MIAGAAAAAAGSAHALTPIQRAAAASGKRGILSKYSRIMLFGDSITEGTDATVPGPAFSSAWAGLLRTAVRAKWGDGGYGVSGPWAALSGTGSAWTYGASWAQKAANNPSAFFPEPFPGTILASNNSADPLTITGVSGDTIDILWMSTTYTGVFTVSIDGGAAQNAGKAAEASGAVFGVTTLNTTAGTHTLTITPPTGGVNYAVPWAVVGRNAAGGGVVHRVARSGFTAKGMLQFTLAYASWAYSSLQSIAPGPQLAIIAFGTNEYAAQGLVSDFQTAMTSLATHFAQVFGWDVMFMTGPPQQASRTIPLSSYYAVLPAINASLGAKGKGVLDINSRWGASWTTANALGFMNNNTTGFVHPNTRGHADIFAALKAMPV